MSDSNYLQSSFLGGEISPLAQGRIDLPYYKIALNVCRNGHPIEEGSWTRRSGTKYIATTYKGYPGRLIPFAFEQNVPYQMEFTDGVLRFFSVAQQTAGLTNPQPSDFRLVTTNDNQNVLNISTDNPAVVQTNTAHNWQTGDQITFLFDQVVNPDYVPLLRNRLFTITVNDANHFTIADGITGNAIDGSTLNWLAPVIQTVVAVRILALQTPYISSAWQILRHVQAETQSILLHGSYAPQNLSVTKLPSPNSFATFSLNAASFLDGPYLDPPTDGSLLLPTQVASTQGTLPSVNNWIATASDGAGHFVTIAYGSNACAISADHGATWTAKTLPATANWVAIAYGGGVFCAIAAGGTVAATSTDSGSTWTLRTLPSSANWSDITWNGTVFCAVAKSTAHTHFIGSGVSISVTDAIAGSNISATSTAGVTWTQQTMPCPITNNYQTDAYGNVWGPIISVPDWTSITAIGSTLITFSNISPYSGVSNVGSGASNIAATSTDNGVTWSIIVLPIAQLWTDVKYNGTLLCAIASGSNSILTSNNGYAWTQRNIIQTANWSALIASNGGVFCAIATGSNIAATSPDAITWTQQALPYTLNWNSVAWDGTMFCTPAYGSNISVSTAGGTFLSTSFTATALTSINGGQGFLSTDVGRAIRMLSEPLNYNAGTTYSVGNTVKFNNAYYSFINGTPTAGKQPDVNPSFWLISTAAYIWTWCQITSIVNPYTINVAMRGPNLLNTNQINTWRLGAYSNTTGWPTCGVYHEGRLWLAGSISNRVDASKSNDLFNFAPTDQYGTVADNNAISYTFNSEEVNPIYWMKSSPTGILCGTLPGEWLIQASALSNPITPTSIQAKMVTTYGCENIEPEHTELTIAFVQRYGRKILESFQDVFSGRVTAQNLMQNAKHLSSTGIKEIRYQQEIMPVIWARMGDGSLIGATYKRTSLFSSQPAEFVGWHRHDLGSGRMLESISVGPSIDGKLDTLSMITNDPTTNIRHVEVMNSVFDVNGAITDGWFVDDAIVPSGGTITISAGAMNLTFYGLWHLNGKSVTIMCGGIDCGDATISNGAVSVPINASVSALFTTDYLQSISSKTAYGASTVKITGDAVGTVYVPAQVGFTYTSQGQLVRPDTVEDTRSATGPGMAKTGRAHQYGVFLNKTQGIKFGVDFASSLHTANFTSKNRTPYTALQLFSGIYWDTIDAMWDFDGMISWQITRPYPATVVSITGFMNTTDR